MNGNPAELPRVTDAQLRLGEAAVLQLIRRYPHLQPMRTRNRWARVTDVLIWASSAYDVLTGFLCALDGGNPDTELEHWLPYLRALVRREGG